MQLLDGKRLSEKILRSIQRRVAASKCRIGLAVVLIGRHPASIAYVRQKKLAAKHVGMFFREIKLAAKTSEKRLLNEIKKLNADKKIHGLIVQLPLPRQINIQKVLMAVTPAKDVDGFHPLNFGKGFLKLPALIPATPAGILRLLDAYKIPLKGQEVVIVGHSNIIGKPLAVLLFNANATVTVCHEFTKNLKAHTQRADILISATGVPKLIKASMVKRGAVVVDCGCAKVGGGLVGDVDFENVKRKVQAITPVPGGVGPMTVATLIENTLKAAGKNF
ncbi:MAG: bifunctional 5,10-methylenetetrahydrofolate dehydrogenase/5,10-methenyltetrahydrofolate cyclohydrolase [Patescibacteria group bacterium]